jgi:UDP-2,3-diacylglucosamine pyrophosphatase LpxH
MKSYLIVPDIHVPFHCPKAVKLITKLIEKLNPDGLVQLGDALDAFQISTYSKDPGRRNLLAEDIEDYKQILNEWSCKLKRGAEIHLLEGNHEHRLSRYIASSCRDLHGLVPDWPTLLGLDIRNKLGKHKWVWHKYNKWNSCKLGDVVLMHGFYYNQHAAATALAKYKTSVIFGHTHRVAYVTDGHHYAAMLGHISNEVETAHQPTPTGWQQSVGILRIDRCGKSHLEIILIHDGRAVVHGEVIKA